MPTHLLLFQNFRCRQDDTIKISVLYVYVHATSIIVGIRNMKKYLKFNNMFY